MEPRHGGGTGGRGPLTLGLGWGKSPRSTEITQPLSAPFRQWNSLERLWPGGLLTGNIFTQARVTQSLVCAESVMPLSSEQEALCRRLEMGRPDQAQPR